MANLITKSALVRRLLNQTTYLKGRRANILIVGETGTGKEVLAQHIHRLEGRKARPFIAVNCAAIPENLLEAELFGHEPGAFTGAAKRRIGKFELADGGDIFLDEISSLKPEMQAKILRVLEEQEFNRIGGNDIIEVDFRVIAASNEPLEEKVARGEFRMDLYHRLRVIELRMPALRQRREDIPLLIEEFIHKFSDGQQKSIAPDAMDMLMDYHWPGNVRELQNAIHSLVILTPGDRITCQHFPEWMLNGCEESSADDTRFPLLSDAGQIVPLKEYARKAEKSYIEYVLDRCNGDRTKTARSLDVGRTTLYGKMKVFDML